MSSGVGGRTDGKEREPASEERMPRIEDFNLSLLLLIWVVEQGIELWDRSTTSHIIPW
jgi:hypothetical protein